MDLTRVIDFVKAVIKFVKDLFAKLGELLGIGEDDVTEVA